jgi:1-acyl-sn-glycerol-3-phosphate acyltransferase
MTIGTDPFGRDDHAVTALSPWLARLTHNYFRTEVEGLEHLPSGPAVLVCNHGGALPWDALVVLQVAREAGRVVRPLIEDAVATAPFVGTLMTRLGCVRASQDNGQRLLAQGELVAVFPEGMQGLAKPIAKRHRLQRFGRGGFVKLAQRAGVPLVPVAVVGGEETAPLLAKVEWLFRDNDRWPYLPITPVLPLPAKWRLRITAPINVAAAVEDGSDAAVAAVADQVRERLQQEVLALVKSRGHAFVGGHS